MSALSDLWAVCWSPLQDVFDVDRLSYIVDRAQRVFHERRFCDWQILALHSDETAARDECAVWQDRRNANPLPASDRLVALQPYIEGLQGLLEPEDRSDS